MEPAFLIIFGLIALGVGAIIWVIVTVIRPDRPPPTLEAKASSGRGVPIFIGLAAALCAVLLLYRLIQGPPEEAYVPRAPTVASVGSNCTVMDGAPMATSPARATEAAQSLAKNDTQNLAAMMMAGHVVLLKKSATARVLERDGAALKVRVLDPGAAGLERWVTARLCT